MSPPGPPPPRAALRVRVAPAARLVAAALAGVLLSSAGIAGWQASEGLRDAGRRALFGEGPSRSVPTPTVNAAAARRHAVEAVFEARSAAILTRDRAAFLLLIDPAATEFRIRQEKLFDQLAKVPFAAWTYEVLGAGPDLSEERNAQLPTGSWTARVLLQYTFEGTTSAADREQYFTLVPHRDSWRLAEDRDADASGVGSQQDVWDLGDITVIEGTKSLVIGHAAADELRPYARTADRAVREVNRIWKGPWSARPVVIVPRTEADMANIIDANRKGLDQIAAVTTGHAHSGPTRGDRVVINPKAWPQLNRDGRSVVMTHEVTHLATRAITHRAPPMWLSEGFADYVAYLSVDVSDRIVAQDLLKSVRDGKTPRSLPADDEFDAARGQLGPAYEGAWLACRRIVEMYGEAKLVELYLAMSDTTQATVDEDVRQVLGISHRQLVAHWQSYLEDLARR